jgi:NAD(P)-dependent dehydrogenase (short-subunit alcohol dehydrogenase family)
VNGAPRNLADHPDPADDESRAPRSGALALNADVTDPASVYDALEQAAAAHDGLGVRREDEQAVPPKRAIRERARSSFRHGWICESNPMSRRIHSSSGNTVLAV